MTRLALLFLAACTASPAAPPVIADVPVDHAAPGDACIVSAPTYDCTTLPCVEICAGVTCTGPRVICTISSLPVCLCLPVGAAAWCPP